MTYEPGRDPQNPLDVHPKVPRDDATRASTPNLPVIVGLMALAVIGALFVYNMTDRATVATETRPAATSPGTTGTGTNPPRDFTAVPTQRPAAAPAPK